MVEIVAIETRKRLRLELLQRQRLRIAERPSDHLFDPVAAEAHLCPRLLGFLPGHRSVVVEVEALEHRIGHLLRLRAGHVLLRPATATSAAGVLRQRLGGNHRRAERDRDKQGLHYMQSFDFMPLRPREVTASR